MTELFRYTDEILERYPHIVGGIVYVTGVENASSPDNLKEEYLQEQKATIQRIGDTLLSQIESLSAWRQAFRGFDVDPTKYRSAPESLLRRLTKKGDIPSINTLVDIGNFVSIRYGLPIAVFDLSEADGVISVRFAEGDETYTDLHTDEVIHPEAGEVIFSDTVKQVFARRWCWRQSGISAANPNTKTALITIEAQHPTAKTDVEKAVYDIRDLLGRYTEGEVRSAILTATNPVFQIS